MMEVIRLDRAFKGLDAQVLGCALMDIEEAFGEGLGAGQDEAMVREADREEGFPIPIRTIRQLQLPNSCHGNCNQFGSCICRIGTHALIEIPAPLLKKGPHVLEVALREPAEPRQLTLKLPANNLERARPPCPAARIGRDVAANRVIELKLLRVGALGCGVLCLQNGGLDGLDGLAVPSDL